MQPLNGTRIADASYKRTVWAVSVPPGTAREDLTTPGFWTHVAKRFEVGHMLEIAAETGDFFGVYRIIHVSQDKREVILKPLYGYDETTAKRVPGESLDDLKAEIGKRYIVSWGGPNHRYRIVDPDSKDVIKHSFSTERLALEEAVAMKRDIDRRAAAA